MQFLKKIFFSAFLCCFTTIVLAQNISVDDSKTATNLVQILTNSSSCVSVSGENAIGDTYTTGQNSYGSFDKNGSSFPFTNGIVLSTWSSIYSVGPFVREPSTTTKSGSLSWKGDTDLENALNKGNTLNATVLEFDFIPQTNYISFNYIFASNEYQDDFPCNYSDGFAFLMKENTPGATYQNLAVLPDGTPVSSTKVHPSFSFNSKTCSPANEAYFGQLNTSATNTSPIDYSGQTIKLTAQSPVKAGVSYHIKLVIADQNGNLYDSAVFLEAGSFSSKIDLGIDRLLATNNPVCFGESLSLDTGLTASTNTYQWFKDGSPTAILGATSSTYKVTEAGTYKVETSISGCLATGQIKIEYTPEIIIPDTSLTKCDDNGSGIAIFSLPENVIKSDIDFTVYNYYKNSDLTNPILNPETYSGSNGEIVYVKVTNSNSPCPTFFKITLHVTTSYLSSTIATTPPIINDFSGNGNSVTLIPPTLGGPFDFSLDGKIYQTSPLFTNLAVGNYTAYIRDTSNCQYWTYAIILLDYPRFFTPNNDGYNDLWKIKNLDLYPKATVSIYDRYGKLLKQLDANSSWDGKYIGNDLPADDYWFVVNLYNGRMIKGHFSLKR